MFNIFLKDSFVDTAFKNISNFDFTDQTYYCKHVEVGCAANEIISRLKTEDTVEHAAIKTFEAECRLFAIGVVEKLRKRILTPRAVNFLKKASCLDPKQMSQPLANLIISNVKILLN